LSCGINAGNILAEVL